MWDFLVGSFPDGFPGNWRFSGSAPAFCAVAPDFVEGLRVCLVLRRYKLNAFDIGSQVDKPD